MHWSGEFWLRPEGVTKVVIPLNMKPQHHRLFTDVWVNSSYLFCLRCWFIADSILLNYGRHLSIIRTLCSLTDCTCFCWRQLFIYLFISLFIYLFIHHFVTCSLVLFYCSLSSFLTVLTNTVFLLQCQFWPQVAKNVNFHFVWEGDFTTSASPSCWADHGESFTPGCTNSTTANVCSNVVRLPHTCWQQPSTPWRGF